MNHKYDHIFGHIVKKKKKQIFFMLNITFNLQFFNYFTKVLMFLKKTS